MSLIMVDLKDFDTGLSEQEKREAIAECQRLRQIQALSGRWILHPDNAPRRGHYHPITGVKL